MQGYVNGKDLKSVFIDVAGLFKNYEQAKVIGISTARDSLTISVDAGTRYVRKIDFDVKKDPINITVPVMFVDLSSFISSYEQVEIEITEFYVVLHTKDSDLTMNIGHSVIKPYEPVGGESTRLNFDELRRALKIFRGTNDIQRNYQKEFSVEIRNGYATMWTPSIWIRTQVSNLNCVLTVDQLRSIVSFMPEYVDMSPGRMEFKKKNAMLVIPTVMPVRGKEFDNLTADMKQVSRLDMSGVIKDLTNIKRSLGISNATITLYQVGFKIEVTKNQVTIKKECNVSGDYVGSYNFMLDIFISCLSLFGEEAVIDVGAKEGLLCLSNQDISILLSA